MGYSAAGFCNGDVPLRIALLFGAWLFSAGVLAAPNEPATLDRSTWPEQLTSPTLFDVASRAEILAFSRALLDSEGLDEPALKQRLGLRMINLEAINALRERMWVRLLANYGFAEQHCYALDNYGAKFMTRINGRSVDIMPMPFFHFTTALYKSPDFQLDFKVMSNVILNEFGIAVPF